MLRNENTTVAKATSRACTFWRANPAFARLAHSAAGECSLLL